MNIRKQMKVLVIGDGEVMHAFIHHVQNTPGSVSMPGNQGVQVSGVAINKTEFVRVLGITMNDIDYQLWDSRGIIKLNRKKIPQQYHENADGVIYVNVDEKNKKKYQKQLPEKCITVNYDEDDAAKLNETAVEDCFRKIGELKMNLDQQLASSSSPRNKSSSSAFFEASKSVLQIDAQQMEENGPESTSLSPGWR